MMPDADAGLAATSPPAHGWRRLALAALVMALSMAIATVLIPPDPDVAAAVGDMPER